MKLAAVPELKGSSRQTALPSLPMASDWPEGSVRPRCYRQALQAAGKGQLHSELSTADGSSVLSCGRRVVVVAVFLIYA